MSSHQEGYGTSQCPSDFLRTWNSTSSTNDIHQSEATYVRERLSTMQDSWSSFVTEIGPNIGYTQGGDWLNEVPMIGSAAGGSGLRGALFAAAVQKSLFVQGSQRQRSKRQGVALGPPVTFDLRARSIGIAGGSFIIPGSSLNSEGGQLKRRQIQNSTSLGNLLDIDLINPAGPNPTDGSNQKYYDIILSGALSKAQAGLQPSLTDIWATMVGYHYLDGISRSSFYTNGTFQSSDVLWSDVPNNSAYDSHQVPFPIVALSSQTPPNGSELASWNEKMVYEMTPLEMGSYDPRLTAWAPTKYLGTPATEGKPEGDCQTGFDRASYMIGTSSSPFYNHNDGNKPNTSPFDQDGSSTLELLLKKLQQQINETTETSSRRYDVGNWPNPFKGVNGGSYADSSRDWLQLGGASNYIPIEQLMVTKRNMSVIFVFDATGETTENKWPDGTAMQIAATRVNNTLKDTHQAFPPIPSNFVEKGVNLHPTFFGCDPPSSSSPEYPLIIYIPNAPPVDGSDPATNANGYKTSYSIEHQNIFMQQAAGSALDGYIPGQPQADPQFRQCLQCAMVDRSRMASSVPRSDLCKDCFQRYCYDSSKPWNSSEIVGRKAIFVDPDLKNQSSSKNHTVELGVGIAAGVFALVAIVAACLFWRRHKRKVNSTRHGGIGVLTPFNTAGGEYAPLKEQRDAWSPRHSYDQPQPNALESYEMGTRPQYAQYGDPYMYDPSPKMSQHPSHSG